MEMISSTNSQNWASLRFIFEDKFENVTSLINSCVLLLQPFRFDNEYDFDHWYAVHFTFMLRFFILTSVHDQLNEINMKV